MFKARISKYDQNTQQCLLYDVSRIQLTFSHIIYLRLILVLFSHLCLDAMTNVILFFFQVIRLKFRSCLSPSLSSPVMLYRYSYVYIYLTVYLRIIPVGNQLDAQFLLCLFESTTCFEQLCTHPQEDNCINTLRTGSFKLFKRPFPGFLTILTL